MSVAFDFNVVGDSAMFVFSDTGKTYMINSSHANWDTIIEKLHAGDYEGLEDLLSVRKKLETYATGVSEVEIDDGGVKYNGHYVSNYLTEKMLSFAKRDLPIKPLVNFFSKLMKNPSSRSVDYLYRFLEHQNMPILANGNFLAYKAVDENYRDYHTGKVDNSIGKQVDPMPRNMVDDDPNNGCSKGYHAGSIEYAKGFMKPGGHLVIVEIDPENCVMVPHDCGFQKLRCTTYLVVGEYEGLLDNDYDNRKDREYYESLDEFDAKCNGEDDDCDSSCSCEDECVQEQIEELQGLISDIKYRIANEDLNSEELSTLTSELVDLQSELEELED